MKRILKKSPSHAVPYLKESLVHTKSLYEELAINYKVTSKVQSNANNS